MKYLFYIIFSLLPVTLICQHSFELKIKTDIDDCAIDILQCADGSYIFVGSSTDNINYRSHGIIYKISPEGNIINNIEINKSDTMVYVDVMDTINGNIVACGRTVELIQNEYYSNILLLYFNSSLEIISEQSILVPDV